MTGTPPVTDWARDYDIFDPDYIVDPFIVWDDLRHSCPIARSERWGGTWMPTTYADVNAIAHDIAHFSSSDVGVLNQQDPDVEEKPISAGGIPVLPPISVDPPLHTWTRRLMLPWFSHRRVEEMETITRELCRSLLAKVVHQGHADAARDYAQQIPVRIISLVLGVPEDMSDSFTGWVRDVLEFAHDERRREAGAEAVGLYLYEQVQRRKSEPGDDLISELLHTEVEGEQITDEVVLGIAALTLIAGVDTTWSAIGSSLWHLATHPDDRRRLVAEPDLLPTATEELLRAYSPVTMARVVSSDVEVNGCPMHAGDKVLLNFPAANRDPAVFDRADEVVIDRQLNRHLAFGAGIHRCAGSNLARMEVRVAIEEWLRAIPEFRLADGAEVLWAGGQVRGPRQVPVVFPG
jgi:cytochrome P450